MDLGAASTASGGSGSASWRSQSVPLQSMPTNSKLMWLSGFGEEQLGIVLKEWFESVLKPKLPECMSAESAAGARCTPGEFARSLCVEFGSEFAARAAISFFKENVLHFRCPMEEVDLPTYQDAS